MKNKENKPLVDPYTQCRLEKPIKTGGVKVQTTWIPSRFAVQDKYLKLKEDGEWENGWQVKHLGSTVDGSYVIVLRDQYRTHRDITDV